MIESRGALRAYLDADQRASSRRRSPWLADTIWRFQRTLRRYEYHLNTGHRVRAAWSWLLWRRRGRRLGFTIPPNVFGPGLSIAHYGTIVVNARARVGANCRLHTGVTIGTGAGETGVPVIGDNCYLGPGAKVFGPVVLGSGTAVGANAVVARSFPEGGCTLGGVPARVISEKSSAGYLIRGA